MTKPLLFRYEGDGEFKAPSAYWATCADIEYVVGEIYHLVTQEERSQASHNSYFASINNAWRSLPDALLVDYPTSEALRKKMLIRCGYADERSIVCASKAEAQRVAAFVRPMDEYAVVLVRDAVVRVFTAQSQSYRAMGKRAFEESQDKVRAAIEDLLGAERGSLGDAA